MKILVTGGAGFIGSHVVDRLVLCGHEVSVLDNFSSGNNRNENTSIFNRDITSDLTDIFDNKFDLVFHFAAQINLRESFKDPYHDAQTNILGSLNVINQAKRTNVKKIIFSSTGGAIYDPHAPLSWTENTLLNPQSPYGLSKLTIEKYLYFYQELHGIKSAIIRFSNVFGPRQNSKGEAGVISIFFDKMINNEPAIIYGTGEQTRDFIYIEDVVEACYTIINNDLSGIFNVCTNTEININCIAHIIKNYLKSESIINYSHGIPGEVLNTKLSYDKLHKISGWKPEFNVDSGIHKMIKSMKSSY